MKKTFLFFNMISSTIVFSQCNIVGNTQINIGQTQVYEIDIPAQCNECYLWSSVGQNLSLENNNLKSVSIKGKSLGSAPLFVSALTSKGTVQCSTTINVIDSNNEPNIDKSSISDQKKCDVDVNTFKDAKIDDENLVFIPESTSKKYKYYWTVSYSNGEKKESEEKILQLPFSKVNQIVSAKIRIISEVCFKELTKIYDAEYWNPKGEIKVPQRIYEQISFEEYSKPRK